MTKFWSFFVDRHHFTVLLMVVLLLAGVYSVSVIPKEATPDIAIPLGIVTTALPGASAMDVERLITDKIEDGVLGVEHVSKVTSTSGEGVSSVSVEFDASADIDKSIQLLKDAVDKVKPELPTDATDPVVSDVNFSDQPILIVSISSEVTPAELTALGEQVQDEVERIEGVAKAELSGVRAREVQVVVSQAKLQQYNLAVSDVTNAIAAAGIAAPAGSIVVDGITYAVRFDAGVSSTDDIANVVVRGPGNVPLRVADIADVVDGLEDPSSYSRVSVDGEPANPSLTLTISKSRGGNIVQIAENVKHRLTELQEGILANTDIVVSYDGAEEVGKSLSELSRVGIETIILIVLVLVVTLGWREAFVSAASIPLSFLIAFIGIYASGNTLNNVSLFSLILAIGILVDSGIVVVEAFHTRLLKYGNKRDAAIAAIKEYAWPLIAGTFTTIVVFVPLFFLSGIVGKFLAAIPFTVIFVLIASIFVALGFVPLLSMFYVKPEHSAFAEKQERYNRMAREWYQRRLHGFLANKKSQNRFLMAMGALFVIALILPATGLLKSIFFPSDDFDYVYINIEKPQGTALAETDLAVREVEEILYADPAIESFVTVVGSGSAFSADFSGAGAGAQIANITVNLPEGHKETSAAFATRLRKDLSPVTSAMITVGEPAGGPPSGAPVTITFTGEDLGALTKTADNAAHTLADIPGTVNIAAGTKDSSAEFVVNLDGAKAAQLGVSAPAVASTLRTALFSSEATSIRSGSDDIEVRTKIDLNAASSDPAQTNHVSIDAVRSLMIPGASGAVPLSSIAQVTYEPTQTAIRHEDGKRVMSVTAEAAPGANAIEISSQFAKKFTDDKLEEGVTMKLGGESEDVGQSFLELFIALIAGAALMLAILVLEFNSFRHSLYLLLLIPLSLIGVHAGLTLVGQPLSLTSMLGVIALAGVIINHAIILMDSIARIHKESAQLSLEEVVVEAAATRFRPIILTTIVTVVGMIPLAAASPFWAPLAIAIMFGLAFSLVLTLVMVPLLYYRWPGKAVRAKFDKQEQPHLI